jgi:hypothetical protein
MALQIKRMMMPIRQMRAARHKTQTGVVRPGSAVLQEQLEQRITLPGGSETA